MAKGDFDDLMDFAMRGVAAQKAVDQEIAKAHSIEKVRQKYRPKDYKSGPGPTGQARLQRSVNSLLLAAGRLSRKSKDAAEVRFAERLAYVLKDFNEDREQS